MLNYRLTILLIILLSGLQSVHAQFIDIVVDLPGSGSKVLSMDRDTRKGIADSTNELQWLQVSVSENILLSVEISYLMQLSAERSIPARYLNIGTYDIAFALPFSGNRAEFATNNCGRLIRLMKGPPKTLTAWIGVPPSQTSELVIEYN